MRILYIGDFTGKGDEALSQISKKYYSYFSNLHLVRKINGIQITKFSVLYAIIKFRPEIIHHLTGPTIRSFVICWFLKILINHGVKTIISATRPYLNFLDRKVIRFFKPDLIFSQASKWNLLFIQAGISTTFLPNPIDLCKFKKLNIAKSALREKYGFPTNKKLLLHVGHLKKNRNLVFLTKLQKKIQSHDYIIIIVTSTYYKKDMKLISSLGNENCIVINQFLDNIEEVYNACDFYIFPPINLSSNYFPHHSSEIGVVDMPISILEAISCEIPIISPPIDSLEIILDDIKNSPIQFVNGIESYIEALDNSKINEECDFSKLTSKFESNFIFNKVDKMYNSIIL